MNVSKPLCIGLTGSIGMGKSTTAQLFRQEGISVLDSDQIVHDLYSGAAVKPIENTFPGVVENGVVNRNKLAEAVLNNAKALKNLEQIVHPLVWQERENFLKTCIERGERIIVYDIPLLFETGADKSVDVIIVVAASPENQAARVLARPGMTQQKFNAIKAKQFDDQLKYARADYIIDTDKGLEAARQQVHDILNQLKNSRGEKNGKVNA